MAEDDDDLEQVRWWDAKALRMADAIERSIVRLHLESQGEFVAIHRRRLDQRLQELVERVRTPS